MPPTPARKSTRWSSRSKRRGCAPRPIRDAAQQISGIVNKAIAVFPKNPRLHYYLARLHIQANRMEEAMKELERVLELDPSDAQAESDLAGLRARFGDSLGQR